MTLGSEVLIRDATDEDVAAITHLLGELGYPTTPDEINQRLNQIKAQPTDRLIMATVQSKSIGLASLHTFLYFPTGAKMCRISAIVVTKDFRGQGVGSQLLRFVEEYARTASCQGIEITTSVRRRETHVFYEQQGYDRTSLRYYKRLD